jgi:hypothetical protein
MFFSNLANALADDGQSGNQQHSVLINHAIFKSVSEASIISDFLVWISARGFLADDPA